MKAIVSKAIQIITKSLDHGRIGPELLPSQPRENISQEETAEVFPEQAIILDTDLGKVKVCCERRPTGQSQSSVPTPVTDVVKCLGIPYATIPYRWAAPRGADQQWQGIRDCTRFGPQCPQLKAPLFPIDDLPLFGNPNSGTFPIQSETEDEFGCLNLNIYAPLSTVRQPKKSTERLPVLIWIHGGAYWTGSGGVDVYDGAEIVARSIGLGSPVIVVTINYRLGVLSYFHSRELALDAANQEDVPPAFRSTANLGLLDSYVAVEWVKRHISSFGGDPGQITGIGESAGAVTWNYLALYRHLHVHIPRLILASSTIFANQLVRTSDAQNSFNVICRKNNIVPNGPDAVSLLRQVPISQLISSSYTERNTFRPIWDDITLPFDSRIVLHDPSMWDEKLEQIVFGHCENESWLRFALCQHDLSKSVNERVPAIKDLRERGYRLYSEERGAQYQWYDSPNENKLRNVALSWMALDGHSRYYAVTPHLCDNFLGSKSPKIERKVYKYIFSWIPNKWPENWPATHTADILSTFLNRQLSPKELAASKTFADELILFTAGRNDRMKIQEFTQKKPVLNVFGRDGQWTVAIEGTGEFGLDAHCLQFWRDVAEATIEIGQGAWNGVAG